MVNPAAERVGRLRTNAPKRNFLDPAAIDPDRWRTAYLLAETFGAFVQGPEPTALVFRGPSRHAVALVDRRAPRRGDPVKFGYFTLSDNHYGDNRRSPNQFIADIVDEALYAEQIRLNSAWIGEHLFSTLGVLSCPNLTLAYIAARTQRIRLAPAVSVLPLHHPIRAAEQWASLDLLSGGRVDFAAGRGYDRREYQPLNVSFEDKSVDL